MQLTTSPGLGAGAHTIRHHLFVIFVHVARKAAKTQGAKHPVF
jgi:hypothetical protein